MTLGRIRPGVVTSFTVSAVGFALFSIAFHTRKVVVMRQNRISKLVVGVVVAAGAMVAGMSTAQAVVYRGSWDPAYGTALPNLGWRGEALFDIPSACLAQGDGLYFNSGICSPETIQSGKVEFYNVLTPGTPTLETLTFDATNIDITIQMRVTNHQLTGVVGAFLLPEESFLSLAGAVSGVTHSVFWLGFQDGQARLANCQYGYGLSCSLSAKTQSEGTMVFAPVPEADGYVLALAGLGVVGAAMTRRRRSTPQSAARS